ncbi:hypothetical protein F5Y04DRAFT_245462 [Hypomontagnella monticulosa]|nr:hypothetical protein F5Y04DRAFT_245462 [Hypomontagnella monticulosa]
MGDENTQESAKARERGNELYRKGRLSEATKEYQAAANLAPSDPSPLSNLSAAAFETGKYAECVEFATRALDLLKVDPATSNTRRKLLARQAKAYCQLSNLNKAQEVLDQLGSGEDANSLGNILKGLSEFVTFSSQPALLREMSLQLPRLRPSIQDEPEFFGPGHDVAESQYTEELKKSADKDPVLSIMLCGIGDARHLYHTILQYFAVSKKTQKLHITILDHKPTVMARNMIFFSLLHQISTDKDSRETLSLSLSYLYCAQIVPPFVWEKLQETISKLVAQLEERKQPVPFIYLPVSLMDAIIKVLKGWQSGPATLFGTKQIRRIIPEHIDEATPPMTDKWHFLPECVADHEAFDDLSVMFPPEAVLSSLEPELSALVANYRKGAKGARKPVSEFINRNWKVNVTLIDVEWLARQEPGTAPDMSSDPIGVVEALTREALKLEGPNRKSTFCVLKHLAEFFEMVSFTCTVLKNRLMVEVIIGDMADTLERLRYGILDRPTQEKGAEESESPKTTDWPQTYHIIHMSNIPDYVGGSFTSFLYGSHVLKEGEGTGLTSCVLRNPPQWKSVNHFNAEYLVMHDRAMIRKHFQLRLANESDFEQSPFSMFGSIMTEYLRWERCESERYPLEQLMSRDGLSKWLFTHFLKICMPYPRPKTHFTLVYAPLNMTALMRLLAQMADVGYPGHWLSSIVASLASGEITTTARAPGKYVLTPAIVDKVYPSRTICVKPWTAEFTTLVTQWRGLFPFTITVPSGILPLPTTITEYSVEITPCYATELAVPHFMLVFWDYQEYGEPPENLYKILVDDERGDTTTSARKIRANGIKVLSTFKWVMKRSTATFWLRSDMVDLMLQKDWRVFIWRIDSWTRLTPGLPLKDCLSRKRTWKECVTS